MVGGLSKEGAFRELQLLIGELLNVEARCREHVARAMEVATGGSAWEMVVGLVGAPT